jgi:N12 class adenine-specific DNA methylase
MLVANNPFFRNPLDSVTDEIRGRALELPDLSQVGGARRQAGGPDLSSLSPRQAPSGNLMPPEQFTPLFLEASARYGVPANVLMALAQQESSYRPDAIGQPTQWGRAKGMMQYIDDTARRVGINPLDPAQSVDAAARQLRERLDKGYSMEEAIMAHHGGDNRSMWGPKTREYAEVVTGKAREIYNQAEGLRTPQEAMAEAEVAAEGEQPFTAGEFEDLTTQERTELLGSIEAEMKRLDEFARPSEEARTALEAQAGEIETLVAQFEERRASISTPEEVEAFNRDLGSLNERLAEFERQRDDYQRRADAFNQAQEHLRAEWERVQQAPERRRSERPEARSRIEGDADELSLEQIRELARDPNAPPEVDALSGAAPKYNDPNTMGTGTVLDLVRQGLGAAKDFLQTPASEREVLSRRAGEGEPRAPREPRPSGILGVDAAGEARRARENPQEVAQQFGRDFDKPDFIDGYTGAAPRPSSERTLLGWVENLSKSGGSGAASAVAGTIEGSGLILQQLENVEADRQMLDAAKGLDTTRLRMAETLRMMEQAGRSDEEILRAVQPWARDMVKRESEFHDAVVAWAEREPNRVAEWLRGMGADLSEIAESWQADPEYQGVATDIAAGVGSMLVYLGPGWLTTLMTKGSTAAIQAAASIAGASALAGPAGAAEAYQRAIDYGLSEDEALRVAMAGIPGGIVQVAPVAVLLQRIPSNVRGKAVGQIRHILESFGAEFVAEGAGAVIQNFVEMSYNEEKGLWDDTLYQAVIGGSSSALIAIGINLASGARGVPGALRNRNQTPLEASGGSLVTPDIMAARALDPWNYPTTLKEVVAARTPDAILDGHLTESAEGAPSGPLEGVMREAQTEAMVEAVHGERVSVATRTGDIAGTVESYTEDGQGGFRIRVLGDDGSMYTYTDADGVTVVRDGGQVADAGREMDAQAEMEAPRESTPGSTGDPGAIGLPPMAVVEAGEATDATGDGESPGLDQPADVAAEGVGLPEDYVQRVQQRIDFLKQAETTQDVEDLIAAEFSDQATADNALQINPERSRFLEAARVRHAELSDTQRQARAGAPLADAPADFQRDPSSPGLWRTPDAAIEFRESGFGDAVSFAAVDAATGETLARGSDMAELLARAQAEREARMVDGEAFMEQSEQEETAPTGEPLVRHTTRKGRELTGVLRDIPLAEAKEIDPYAFRKDGRSFIRVDRLRGEQQGQPIEEPTPSRDNREVVAQDTDATPGTAEVTPAAAPDRDLILTTRNTPFASFEKAQNAMRNRRIEGRVVQIYGGWAIERSAPVATPADFTPQYQDAVSAKIATQKRRVMRLRREPETEENVAKLRAAERRLRQLRNMAAQEAPAGWSPGDPIQVKGQPVDAEDTSAERVEESPIDRQEPVGQFAGNTIFTEDKVAAARARLKAKLGQINTGLDPEMLVDGMTIAGAYIESGVRRFSDYAKAMIDDLGTEVKPYLLSFYEGARNYPGLDTEGMTPVDAAKREHEAMLAEPAAEEDAPTSAVVSEEVIASAEAAPEADAPAETPPQQGRRVGESRTYDTSTPEGIRERMTELREDWAELAAIRDEQGMVTDARLESKIRDIETLLAELRQDLERMTSGASTATEGGSPKARQAARIAKLRELARKPELTEQDVLEGRRLKEEQLADPQADDEYTEQIEMGAEFLHRKLNVQQQNLQRADAPSQPRPERGDQPAPRPTDSVLRPEGRQRWRTERVAEKFIKDNDLLGVYVVVPEGKGFILERRAPYNLEIETRSYESRAFGDEPVTAYETILHRPEGMPRELFVAVVRAKVKGAKKFLKDDTQVAINDAEIGPLADHLQSNLIDRRDPGVAPPIPREEMPRDPGADTDPDTESLVDSAPHSGAQAEPGADPAPVDGARPDNTVGDGQPDSDRSGRADGVDRGEGAGPGAAPGAGGRRSDPRAGKSPANKPHGRTEDRPHQLEGENPGNFVITDELGLGEGTTGQKISGNLEAIRLMKEIVSEGRFATPAEQAVLARYVGWGGLKSVFDVKKRGATDMYGRAQAELRALLTPEEYEAAARSTRDAHYTAKGVVDAMWRAARHFGFTGGRALEPTVGTGNFLGLQPADLAAATEWHAAELDSVTGAIASLLYPEANVLAATGFQDAPFANGVFRLAIGNPPFGELRIRDKSKQHGHLDGMRIHNYIIGKAGDHLAPGGVMQMVVTHRFLDTANPEARDYLAKHFRFLGAIRLPNDAFEQNAGTSVTTDIVFLQKLRADEVGDANAAWLDVNGEIEVDGVKMRVNRYFQENPQHILGKSSMGGSMYRGDGQEYTVESDGRDIGAEVDRILAEDWADLEGIMAETNVDKDVGAAMLNVSDLPVGGMMLDPEGRLLRRDLDDPSGNAVIEEITPESYWREQAAQWEQAINAAKALRDSEGAMPTDAQVAAFLEVAELALDAKGEPKASPTKAEQAILDIREAISEPATFAWRFDEGLAAMEATLGRKQLGRKGYDTLRKLMDLRNRTLALIRAEKSDDPAMDTLRQELNQAYDAFVASHGLISDPDNIKLLAGDIGVEVGLESGYQPAIKPAEAKVMGVKPKKSSAKKAAIMSQRVAYPYREITSADSPRDALTISLSERGKLDLAYMSDLTGQPIKALIEDLSTGDAPAIFYDPAIEAYEHAEAYLSGNVKRKLDEALALGLEANARALEAVQPAPLTAERITPSMRGTWMPTDIFEGFLEALGVRGATVNIIDTVGMIKGRGVTGELTDLGVQFNDPDADIITLFNAATSGKSLTVWRGRGDERYVDKAASTRVTALAERMAKVFGEWAYSDAQRQAQVVDAFNRKMNTHRERTWDGEKYLKTVGQSPAVKLRRHQKNAAWRMIQSQAVLTDHVVGAGKTFTLITGIMERKRLGLSRKPMVVVPNHLVVQWASDFYQLYPGANILAATPDDFTKKNRRRLFARIATGDYDAVIVGHSSFGFIEPGESDTQNVIRERKKLLEQAMEDARLAGESKRTMRQMQNKLDSYDDRLKKLAERSRDDIGITLEDMGVDYLAVDEAHEFKNLEYATSSERVVGMNDPKGSQRAFDLYVKVRGIQERQGGVAFATGTPVSNSLVELYTVMSYLATPELQARGLDHYDAWAGAYAVTETRMEYTATQKIKPRRVLAGLSNLESLSQLYRQFADVITMDDLKRLYAEEKAQSNAETGANERTEFPVPKVAAGGRQLDTSAITPQQAEFMDYLVARMQGIEANKQDPEYAKIDNPLWVLSDARKMSLDIRTVDPQAARDDNGKVMRSARRIKDIYDRWSDDRGTQLVFSDLSTPAKQAGKNARKIVRDALTLLFNDKVARARMKAMRDLPFMEQWKQTVALSEDVMADPALAGDKLEKIEAFFAQAQEFEVEMQTADTGFSVYDDLREVLIEMGIPAGEIAFIHDYNTPEKKQRLFARVNAGAVRVLIGSTPKMGAGTNVQERLVALHHLDAPWRPSDVEQREGRIIRQGNKLYERDPDGFEVEIHAYSTNGTSDTVMWQILERKAGAIEQFRIGGLDSMSEAEGDADQYAEFMASSTGNPVFRLKLEAERDLTEARAETSGRAISVDNAKRFLRDYPERKAKLEATIAGLEPQALGDLSFAGETASVAEHDAAMAEAMAAFEEAYADYQAKLPLAEAKREKAVARGDTKLPPLPARPSRPHIFSKEVVEKSAYARLWQKALADVAAGPKDMSKRVSVKLGTINLTLERAPGYGKDVINTNLYLEATGERHFSVGHTAAKPEDSSSFRAALEPAHLTRELALALDSQRQYLAELERRQPREAEVAEQSVDESRVNELAELQQWYAIQVAFAEYHADTARGERENRYIAAERNRKLGNFENRESTGVRTYEVDGEAYTTTGAVSNQDGFIALEAVRDRDNRPVVLRGELVEGQLEVTGAIQEPAAARAQMRSATARSVAANRERTPRMGDAEVVQRLMQSELGEAADAMIASGKIQVLNHVPANLPRGTQAYVDADGTITLVARNLTPETILPALLHEAFHAGARPLIGTKAWNELQGRLAALYRQYSRSPGAAGDFFAAARQRIEAAEAAGDAMGEQRRIEEFGAYAIEAYEAAPRTLKAWVNDMVGRVKAWAMRTFGIQLGQVSPAQLRALAAAALRNGEMAASPALAVTARADEGGMVDAEGNPVPEDVRRQEVRRAVAEAQRALSVKPESFVADFDSGVTRDIGRITYWTHHPYTIASMEEQFTPVFTTAMRQNQFRDQIIAEMYPKFRAYKELTGEGRARVNRVLELGRLLNESYTDFQLRAGIKNPGFKTVVVHDAAGNPVRRREPLNTALSKRGEVIKLSKVEREAYAQLREMFDDALDLFRDQTLLDMGLAEFTGLTDPAGAMLDSITDDMPQAQQERLRNMAQMAEEIEQAKRAGYVPLSRYGRFAITVRETLTDIQYVKNPQGGWIARGVPDDMAGFMGQIGATYNELEGGWQINQGQRKALQRETTRTVYSEKVEITGYRDRLALWKASKSGAKAEAAIPEVRRRLAEVKERWGGANRTISVLDTQRAREENQINLADLDSLADLAHLDNETWDRVRDEFAQAMQGRGFRRHFFQSDNVPGYTDDFERSIADYMASMAGYLSRRHHQKDWQDAISGVKGERLRRYAHDYQRYVNDPAEEYAVLRQTGFLFYIAGNVSTAALNATQVPIMTMPILSQAGGQARAAAEVARAYKDALAMTSFIDQAREGWKRGGLRGSADMMLQMFDPADAPADVRAEVQAAWDDGMFAPQFTHEVMGFSGRRDGSAAAKLERTIDFVAASYTYVERMNRLVTFIAAVRMAKAKGVQAKANQVFAKNALAKHTMLGQHWSPENFATFIVNESQFMMGKANRSKMLRSHGAPIFQFMSFVLNSLQAWYRWASLHGRDGKMMAAASVAAIVALSGVWGAPGLDHLRQLYEDLWRWITDEDEDVRHNLREWIFEKTGRQWIAEVADKGGLYPLGIDMSRRIGLQNILPGTSSVQDALGIPADLLVGRPQRAWRREKAGDRVGAVAELMPNFIKNPVIAQGWRTEGAYTSRGDLLLRPDQIPTSALWWKSFGVQPTIVSDVQDYLYRSGRDMSRQSGVRSRFANRLARVEADAIRNQNPERAAQLEARIDAEWAKLDAYNERNPGNEIEITPQMINSRLNRMLDGVDAVIESRPRDRWERDEQFLENYNVLPIYEGTRGR